MKKFKTSTGSGADIFTAKNIEFKEFKLANGLKCIFYRDDKNPIVNVTVGYKVGSKDEENGKKGIAHLFEHLMFQGSDNVKKNEHFEFVMKSGGVCNAFTSNDITVYFDRMPANNLEMALWLESDRMNSLDISEENLSNQKNVVIEEKKQHDENSPYGSTHEKIFKNLFRGSGYETAVIGEIDDINSFTLKEAKEFHYKYYSPQNSVLIISGDFEYEYAEKLIDKYFAGIRKDGVTERKINTVKELPEDTDVIVKDNVQLSALNLCWQTPKLGSDEFYPFEYFIQIIANKKSSRLYKKLVYEKKLLKSVRAVNYGFEDSGLLILNSLINPGTDPETIKKEILLSIEELAAKGCDPEEFNKVRNQIEFENTAKHLSIQTISLDTVFNYLYFKNVSRINTDVDKYLSVTNDDVISIINKYILGKHKLSLLYLPKDK